MLRNTYLNSVINTIQCLARYTQFELVGVIIEIPKIKEYKELILQAVYNKGLQVIKDSNNNTVLAKR